MGAPAFLRVYKLCGDLLNGVFHMRFRAETRRHPKPLGPLRPDEPLERPWPSPVPGVPFPSRRKDRNEISKIMDKLVEIEKRLERIEKFLVKKFGPIQV